jgi:hypothetical protein
MKFSSSFSIAAVFVATLQASLFIQAANALKHQKEPSALRRADSDELKHNKQPSTHDKRMPSAEHEEVKVHHHIPGANTDTMTADANLDFQSEEWVIHHDDDPRDEMHDWDAAGGADRKLESVEETKTLHASSLPSANATSNACDKDKLCVLVTDKACEDGSPQEAAVDWILTKYFDINNQTELLCDESDQVSEIFSLAVLYYSTRGDSWFEAYGFLSGLDPCEWYGIYFVGLKTVGVDCDVDGKVTSLKLRK